VKEEECSRRIPLLFLILFVSSVSASPRFNSFMVASSAGATGAVRNVTAFETKVYELCKQIPKGKVSTYGSMAKALGCGAPRSVGQALRRNPFAPTVPCHRVVAADRRLGGFL